MERKMFEVVCASLLLIPVAHVFSQVVSNQKFHLEISPATLVYFGDNVRSWSDPANATLNTTGGSFISSVSVEAEYPTRPFVKGDSPYTSEKGSDIVRRNVRRCSGVCFYIPDRDFCPTDIPEESEEDYDYSDENSIEDSEEYDDDGRRREPQSGNDEKGSPVKNGTVSGAEHTHQLPVVYPLLTRFAASRNSATGGYKSSEKDKTRNRVSARRKRRQRRPFSPAPKFRAPALEQETVIRWDRVVERGPYIGGDIVLPFPTGVLLRPPNFRYPKKRWTNGKIPFLMDSQLNTCRQNAIFDAMDEIEDRTCIRFVERKNERNYLHVMRANIGCASYVGMIGGVQQLNLSTGCFSKFTVTHELMHAIGFDHEQSRKDRDKYIEVDFNNVLRHKETQFELNPSFSGSGFPYDVRSIMHYSAFLFAKNKCEPTIYPVNNKVDLCDLGVGNGRGGMTNCDAAKINKMYNCGRKYPKKCKL